MNIPIQALVKQKNLGKTHLFLGDCFSSACDKTTVEPGNCFSPGVWSFGIYWGLETSNGYLAAHQTAPPQLQWGFADGLPPVVRAEMAADCGVTAVSSLTHLGIEGAYGADFCLLEICNAQEQPCSLYITIKETGPAGGRISSMRSQSGSLIVNDSVIITPQQAPHQVVVLPPDQTGEGYVGVLAYSADLAITSVAFKVEHGFYDRPFGAQLPHCRPFAAYTVEQGFTESRERWSNVVPARLFCPDHRLEQLWQRELFHILAAMEHGMPRIGAVNYPIFWMRDAIVILRALDLVGRHDLARNGNDYLAPLLYSGGFGAEADAPGEALWTLVSHADICQDKAWLESIFPLLAKRVGEIRQMCTTPTPIYRMTESRMPAYQSSPAINLVCLPNNNGCIHGRMDWHCPDFFINCWAVGGLQAAIRAAASLGRDDLVEQWGGWLAELEAAVEKNLLPDYGNDRDSIITPYPSGALADRLALRDSFLAWYWGNRLDSQGNRIAEPLWTYFEAAQAHNALLLGFTQLAWVNIQGMIDDGNEPYPISAYSEGLPGGNEYLNFKNGEARLGWLDAQAAAGGNMPHNWTSAELVNMIHDIFLWEKDDELVLGQGVPLQWLRPGCRFGVENFPTKWGIVSYTATVGENGKLNIVFSGIASHRLAEHLLTDS